MFYGQQLTIHVICINSVGVSVLQISVLQKCRCRFNNLQKGTFRNPIWRALLFIIMHMHVYKNRSKEEISPTKFP